MYNETIFLFIYFINLIINLFRFNFFFCHFSFTLESYKENFQYQEYESLAFIALNKGSVIAYKQYKPLSDN